MENTNDALDVALAAKEDLKLNETTEEFKPDEVEQAAIFLNQSHKRFKQLVYNLSERKKRAAPRVLEAVLFEPLEKVELIGKEEQELFDLCLKIMYSKGRVMQFAFEEMEKKKGETNDNETKE